MTEGSREGPICDDISLQLIARKKEGIKELKKNQMEEKAGRKEKKRKKNGRKEERMQKKKRRKN
jgi:hypothetical protein